VSLAVGDGRLIAIVDAVTGRAVGASGHHLVCQPGCSPCCFGPFAITQLDAWRLQEGLRELGKWKSAQVAAVRQRAGEAVSEQAVWFPHDRVGIFLDETDESGFHSRFSEAPCPALDPETGSCLLYSWRPIVCRTHGPPLSLSGQSYPPCPLCFRGATTAELEKARVQLNVDASEEALTRTAERKTGRHGMTTVAFAIAGFSDR